jgi:tRNA dimethylallyltransferase
MKEVAIIGPTASGKSALALAAAQKCGAIILSLDSLAIYRGFDIVSAKPTPEELALAPHYGIDIADPDEHFNIARYFDIFAQAREHARKEKRPLIIVGGSVFYLKALLDGLSPMPAISPEAAKRTEEMLQDLAGAYTFLERLDPAWAARITKSDRYRIQKALELYFATGTAPSDYFADHPPLPLIQNIPIYAIDIDRERLRQNLRIRTRKMITRGVVEEIYGLARRYGRAIAPMKAVGVVETLGYLDGRYDLAGLADAIVTSSAQLAKRQRTFIRTQIPQAISIAPDDMQTITSALGA